MFIFEEKWKRTLYLLQAISPDLSFHQIPSTHISAKFESFKILSHAVSEKLACSYSHIEWIYLCSYAKTLFNFKNFGIPEISTLSSSTCGRFLKNLWDKVIDFEYAMKSISSRLDCGKANRRLKPSVRHQWLSNSLIGFIHTESYYSTEVEHEIELRWIPRSYRSPLITHFVIVIELTQSYSSPTGIIWINFSTSLLHSVDHHAYDRVVLEKWNMGMLIRKLTDV